MFSPINLSILAITYIIYRLNLPLSRFFLKKKHDPNKKNKERIPQKMLFFMRNYSSLKESDSLEEGNNH